MNGYLITVFCCSCIIIACSMIWDKIRHIGGKTLYIVIMTTMNISVVCFIVFALFGIVFPIKAKRELVEFKARKEYIEIYYEKGGSSVEDYEINNEVIELNLWLFRAKESQESFGTWSVYYDIDLSNVEPIALR